MFDSPPLELLDSDFDLLDHLRDFSALKTLNAGENGHYPIDGVGEHQNFHKKSISKICHIDRIICFDIM